MTDHEMKLRIKPLSEKSDYGLWRIRVQTACSAKDLSDVFERRTDGAADDERFQKRQRQASDIIVSTLTDESLRVVMTVIGDPRTMLEKLDDRYRSTTTASKISKITEFVSVRYKSPCKDIAKHIDKMAAIVEELRNMDMKLDNTLTVGILVASIKAPELAPVVAAIITLAENDLKWEIRRCTPH